MEITVTGQHVEITDSLRAFVKEKLARLERHFDRAIDTHVVLAIEGDRQVAQARLSLPGHVLHAESQGDDMYGAIDTMVDKLDSQVRKHKERDAERSRR